MGKKTSKQTTDSAPWKPAQSSILGAINTTQNTVDANQGNLNNIANNIGSYLPQLGQMAFGQNPTMNAANSYATDVLGGKYLNSNPYMDQMINATAGDVQDRVNSMFGQSGAALGTPYASAMTKELANAENSMRYGNYNQERQNQQGAAGLAPSLFASQFSGVSPLLSASTAAGTLPYAGLSNLSSIIGLAGESGQGSKTVPGGWGTDILNGAITLLASDRRLKTNIEKVGEARDGLGVYEWNWKADPDGTKVRGVIADEVERLRPWAYAKGAVNGVYDGVNYAALGSLA